MRRTTGRPRRDGSAASWICLWASLLATAALVGACDHGPAASPPPPPVPVATSITISPATATLESLQQTVQLTATVLDQTGRTMTGVGLTWSTSDESVATVDGTGLATSVGDGTATIGAAAGAVTGTAEVTVEQRPVEVRVSPATATLTAVGDTIRLSAEALDANGHPAPGLELSWSTSDEAVATVDGNGLVSAVGAGTATIRASAGSLAATAEVTVEQRATRVRVSPDTATLTAVGDTVRLTAEAFDRNDHPAPAAEFTWTSLDNTVATVDEDGLVTAVALGWTVVRAETGSGAAGARRGGHRAGDG